MSYVQIKHIEDSATIISLQKRPKMLFYDTTNDTVGYYQADGSTRRNVYTLDSDYNPLHTIGRVDIVTSGSVGISGITEHTYYDDNITITISGTNSAKFTKTETLETVLSMYNETGTYETIRLSTDEAPLSGSYHKPNLTVGNNSAATHTLQVVGSFGAAQGTATIDLSASTIIISGAGNDSMNLQTSGTYVTFSDDDINISATNGVSIDSVLNVSGSLNSSDGRIVKTTRVNSTPYNILATDHYLFVDTDSAAITANLPAGINGTHYKIANTGTSGNDVTIVPDGSELLLGYNLSITIADGDSLDIVYESTEGWA